MSGSTTLAMNDGGDVVTVYELDGSCAVVGERTAAVDPYDPEDMALAADGTVWLADTGDNRLGRSTVALIALAPDGAATVHRMSYPDGPRDAEALLLAPDGTPYLVTKEVLGTSEVYRPAQALDAGAVVPLEEVADPAVHPDRHRGRPRRTRRAAHGHRRGGEPGRRGARPAHLHRRLRVDPDRLGRAGCAGHGPRRGPPAGRPAG